MSAQNRSTGKRVTIRDIAQISGYSKTSVSFAFNDPNRISKKAHDAILKVAEELGYIPDPLARNLSLRKHHSIGILLADPINRAMKNPYIAQVIQGIGSICQYHGHSLTLIPPLNESMLDAVRTAAVDGLVTLGMEAEMNVVGIIEQRGIPHVTIDGSPSINLPSININDREAAYTLMKEVLEAGHRKILIVSLPQEINEWGEHDSVTLTRTDGYTNALEEYGFSIDGEQVERIPVVCTMDGGKTAARRILKSTDPPTAAVCMSDIIAIGLQRELQSNGWNIPKDISVVGFDNIIESALVTPPLTTVDQPGGEKGRRAAELIFKLMQGEVPERIHLEVPYRVITRESLGAPAGTEER